MQTYLKLLKPQEAQEDQLAQMLEEIQQGNTDSEVESEGEESEDQSRDID